MDWTREWKWLILLVGGFLAVVALPVGSPRVDGAVLEALQLLRWYAREHVLLCLVPALFIAGAISVFVGQASVMKYLGARAGKARAYGVASVAGTVLAVCSCTIVPLFAGIYRKGAGIGPAITFLFFAPAGNIMALAYTGSILGSEFVIARLLLCLLFGIGIGMLMAMLFWRDDASHDAETDTLFAEKANIAPAALGVLVSLVGLLIAGTLKLWPLTATVFSLELPLSWAQAWQDKLFAWVPFDAARGEEGVSFQGSVLIALLLLIAAIAWKGLENIVEGANQWTWLTLGLSAITLAVAAMCLTPGQGTLEIAFTGRVVGVTLALEAVWHFAQ